MRVHYRALVRRDLRRPVTVLATMAVRYGGEAAARAWRSYRHQAARDAHFATALTEVAATAIELVAEDVRVHGVVRTVADASVAVHRALEDLREQDPPHT